MTTNEHEIGEQHRSSTLGNFEASKSSHSSSKQASSQPPSASFSIDQDLSPSSSSVSNPPSPYVTKKPGSGSQVYQSDEMLQRSVQDRKPLLYTKWQALSDGAGPTPFFIDILRTIFTHLDSQHTGMLSPEQYSSFLDAQRYGHDQNFWRRGLKPLHNVPEEYSADATLRAHYDAFFIPYVLRPRSSPPLPSPDSIPRRTFLSLSAAYLDAEDVATAARAQALQPIIDPDGQMPMLVLQGFLNLTFVETLREPGVGWERLGRAMREFGACGMEIGGREWGPMPRDCLPPTAPELLLETCRRIEEVARANEERAIEAERLKIEARRGVDGQRYFYRN